MPAKIRKKRKAITPTIKEDIPPLSSTDNSLSLTQNSQGKYIPCFGSNNTNKKLKLDITPVRDTLLIDKEEKHGQEEEEGDREREEKEFDIDNHQSPPRKDKLINEVINNDVSDILSNIENEDRILIEDTSLSPPLSPNKVTSCDNITKVGVAIIIDSARQQEVELIEEQDKNKLNEPSLTSYPSPPSSLQVEDLHPTMLQSQLIATSSKDTPLLQSNISNVQDTYEDIDISPLPPSVEGLSKSDDEQTIITTTLDSNGVRICPPLAHVHHVIGEIASQALDDSLNNEENSEVMMVINEDNIEDICMEFSDDIVTLTRQPSCPNPSLDTIDTSSTPLVIGSYSCSDAVIVEEDKMRGKGGETNVQVPSVSPCKTDSAHFSPIIDHTSSTPKATPPLIKVTPTTNNELLSDSTVTLQGLVHEMSKLNQYIQACKRELDVARRQRMAWIKKQRYS